MSLNIKHFWRSTKEPIFQENNTLLVGMWPGEAGEGKGFAPFFHPQSDYIWEQRWSEAPVGMNLEMTAINIQAQLREMRRICCSWSCFGDW